MDPIYNYKLLHADTNNTKKRLLVISCTDSKREVSNAPAIETYDGPTFRILRKYLTPNIDVLIISAKYGIINSGFLISSYNQKMTSKRALELRPSITAALKEALTSGRFNDVFFELGKRYQQSLDIDFSGYSGVHIEFDAGTIGVRLHNLKTWLEKKQ